jgi:hypothetical protein
VVGEALAAELDWFVCVCECESPRTQSNQLSVVPATVAAVAAVNHKHISASKACSHTLPYSALLCISLIECDTHITAVAEREIV